MVVVSSEDRDRSETDDGQIGDLARLSSMGFKISEDISSTRLGDETVLLHLKRGIYFGFDPIGTRVWEGLGEKRRLDEICAEISRDFSVDLSTVEADVHAFVSDLVTNEILEVGNGSSPA